MTSLSVLAPNGRRQTVKVTPNTTLLQVLEDVCKKQGLNPDEYNIKHFNKILDLSLVIRFSGLPNNAQLELVRAGSLRQESKVHIALQVGDSTSRVTADFWPSDTLIHVVQTLTSDELSADSKTPVVIYMRKEVIGVEALRTTQLKSFGLTGGSAVLRLVLRDNALPPEQKTSGSGMYFKSPPAEVKHTESRTQQTLPRAELQTESNSSNMEAMDCSPSGSQHFAFSNLPQTVPLELTRKSKNSQGTASEKTDLVTLPQAYSTVASNNKNSDEQENAVSLKGSDEMEVSSVESVEEIIQYIGERNALIFKQGELIPGSELELPDDFFDLTLNDFRALTKDYKRKLKELENIPLQTSAQRELQQSKQMLNRLNYKSTVIRIQFPDRLVLQGVFTPFETVAHVIEFVRKFLQQPDIQFHLYMTPPKVVLDPQLHLVEADCVPRALVYFGAPECDTNTTYVHTSYLANLSTPRQASKAALLHCRKNNVEENESIEDSTTLEDAETQREAVSTQTRTYAVVQSNRPGTSNNNDNQPKQIVPKWFKK